MRFGLPKGAYYRTRVRADQLGKQREGGNHEQDHHYAYGDLLCGRSPSAVSGMAGRPETLCRRCRARSGLHALDRLADRRMTLAQ